MLPSFLFAATLLADSAVPRVVLMPFTWHSASGRCTTEAQRVRVEGVPSEVEVRIEAELARALAAQTHFNGETPALRNTACAKFLADSADGTSAPAGSIDEKSDWKIGLAKGRWLSVRLHTTSFYTTSAHPEDQYESVTFDLAHGGYPVPTGGFYSARRRAGFNAALHVADRDQFNKIVREAGDDTPDPNELAREDAALNVVSAQILLTPTGIEVTNTKDGEAARNFILSVPYAALDSVGTQGGPLDPKTR